MLLKQCAYSSFVLNRVFGPRGNVLSLVVVKTQRSLTTFEKRKSLWSKSTGEEAMGSEGIAK